MRSPCVSVGFAAALAVLALARAAPAVRETLSDMPVMAPAFKHTPGAMQAVKSSPPSDETLDISQLRSRFKEDLGLDVPEEDVAFLAHGARYALSADDVEDEKLAVQLEELRHGLGASAAPAFPVEAVEHEADVDAQPYLDLTASPWG